MKPPLVQTFKTGSITCHLLDAGLQRLDGGAMFGVVPKPLWERVIPPDEANRIPLAMRCLLVEHPGGLVLIDTGMGNKEPDKTMRIYGIENEGTQGPTRLEDAIVAAGHAPADVKTVINTHLHFDHAGGNTFRDGNGVHPSFPNATYVVQRGELKFAGAANERTSASYLPHNWEPIREARRWQTVDGEVEVVPGIRVIPTPGHVPHHQSVLISDGGQHTCFLADVIPTSAHVPLPWIMGYDVEPLRTLETKRWLLERAARENWVLTFEHDPVVSAAHVSPGEKAYRVEPIDFLEHGA